MVTTKFINDHVVGYITLLDSQAAGPWWICRGFMDATSVSLHVRTRSLALPHLISCQSHCHPMAGSLRNNNHLRSLPTGAARLRL